MLNWMLKYANSANLFITNLCNCSCSYCCVNDWITDDGRSARYMRLEDLDLVIETLKISQIGQVRLLGGEPMLHPRVHEFVKRLLEEDITKISILTNGLGRTEDYERIMGFEGIRWCVNVNDPTTYAPDEWDLFNDNLGVLSWKGERDRVLGHGVYEEQGLFQLQLAIVFYEPDQDYRYVIDLAKKYGSPIISFDISHPSSSKTNVHVELEDMTEHKNTILDFVNDCVQEGIRPSLGCVLPPCVFTPREMAYIMLFVMGAKFSCVPSLDIMPNLDVEYCSSMRGSLTSYNLRKVGKGMTLQHVFKRLANEVEKVQKHPAPYCEGCYRFEHNICQGYCLRLKSDLLGEEPETKMKKLSFLDGVLKRRK